MMTETNKKILQKANDAVSIGNYEDFFKYCTEDTKWTFIGDQILDGKDQVREWMLNEYIEPPINDVKNIVAENEYLTVMGYLTVKTKSGESNKYSYCDVWKFRNGKMAELLAFVVESDDMNKSDF